MPPPNALPGDGTQLQIMIGATYTKIGLVTEIDGPSFEVGAVQTTTLDSALHTSRPSRLPKPDKCPFKLWFDPNDTTTHALLYGRISTPGTIDDFKIVFNDDNATHAFATFSGFFSKFKLTGIKVEENVAADCEITLTTLVAFTAGTP